MRGARPTGTMKADPTTIFDLAIFGGRVPGLTGRGAGHLILTQESGGAGATSGLPAYYWGARSTPRRSLGLPSRYGKGSAGESAAKGFVQENRPWRSSLPAVALRRKP